jgi:hypothetical protein
VANKLAHYAIRIYHENILARQRHGQHLAEICTNLAPKTNLRLKMLRNTSLYKGMDKICTSAS